MNSKQRKQREFLLKKGLIKPVTVNPNASYKRTEGNQCFHYGNATANAWDGWSRDQRDIGKQPTFKNFYEQLSDEYKQTVIVLPVQIITND